MPTWVPRAGVEVALFNLALDQFPYGTSIPPDVYQQIVDGVSQLPDEPQQQGTVGQRRVAPPWELVGPWGMRVRGSSTEYSGRILDLTPPGPSRNFVAAANGGLWKYGLFSWIPLSDEVRSLAIGSFAVDPEDEDRIIIGTGEPGLTGGLGIYNTSDGGATWVRASTPDYPAGVYRIRHAPWDQSQVFAATTSGFFRSTDAGVTWDLKTAPGGGNCTSFALDPLNANVIYATFEQNGIYKSTTPTPSFTKLVDPNLPDSDLGRMSIALAPSSPNILYVLMSAKSTELLTSIFRSDDSGASWNQLPLPRAFQAKQAEYNNVISVSPTDPNMVLLGCVKLYRSEDGGQTWDEASGYHADVHAFEWNADGQSVGAATDGGLFNSRDRGKTWASVLNDLPITQYESIAVCETDPELVTGGAQDNGLSWTDNLSTWEMHSAGDGGGVAIQDLLCQVSWSTLGVMQTGSDFQRRMSGNNFGTFTTIESGIPLNQAFTPKIRWTQNAPQGLFTHTTSDVFASDDIGLNWNRINVTPFPVRVDDIAVSRMPPYTLYICTGQVANTDLQRIWRYKDGTLTSVDSSVLPDNAYLRKITPHSKIPGRAWLIVSGQPLSAAGGRVWKTADFGDTWTDISASLPAIFPLDVIAHPGDPEKVIIGTTTGAIRTDDGGATWYRWNSGMPFANWIQEFRVVPADTGVPGEYWLYAASYGRSMWRRLLEAPTPTGTDEIPPVERVRLEQNHPNPFNARTTITWYLPRHDRVTLNIYDLKGRLVRSVVDVEQDAGEHSALWDGTDVSGKRVASGTYIYRLRAGTTPVSRRMVLLQ